jgi:hypothetical protein
MNGSRVEGSWKGGRKEAGWRVTMGHRVERLAGGKEARWRVAGRREVEWRADRRREAGCRVGMPDG